jgi:hypothetical protein
MSWDAPSPTITTQFFGFGNGRFGHPEQDRALSLREGALLQGLPPRPLTAMRAFWTIRATVFSPFDHRSPVGMGAEQIPNLFVLAGDERHVDHPIRPDPLLAAKPYAGQIRHTVEPAPV